MAQSTSRGKGYAPRTLPTGKPLPGFAKKGMPKPVIGAGARAKPPTGSVTKPSGKKRQPWTTL